MALKELFVLKSFPNFSKTFRKFRKFSIRNFVNCPQCLMVTFELKRSNKNSGMETFYLPFRKDRISNPISFFAYKEVHFKLFFSSKLHLQFIELDQHR